VKHLVGEAADEVVAHKPRRRGIRWIRHWRGHLDLGGLGFAPPRRSGDGQVEVSASGGGLRLGRIWVSLGLSN
jgi:hypothetical protein